MIGQTASTFCPFMKNVSKPQKVIQEVLIHNHVFALFNFS
jgi:thioredoxin-related protein